MRTKSCKSARDSEPEARPDSAPSSAALGTCCKLAEDSSPLSEELTPSSVAASTESSIMRDFVDYSGVHVQPFC